MTNQYVDHANLVAQGKATPLNVVNSNAEGPTPAEQLVGKELPNGWKVIESNEKLERATGGQFSKSYIVKSRAGERAFLKAMDYRRALKSPDPARALQDMTAAYNFERDILEKCKLRGLSRVVRVLDAGTLPAQDGEESSVVQYLIFELADGDIRSYVNFGRAFETAWALRTMHQTAAAVQQLHSVQIAHQDLKPSNVLIFEDSPSKLADLGRASDREITSVHDKMVCAGDRTYAPPELLYGHVPQDWRIRRLGCDMYLLGSLIVFFCTGVSMTHLIFNRLDARFHFENWGGTYNDVLPYLEQVFAQIIREFRAGIQPEFTDKITKTVKELCNPNPEVRGDSKNMKFGGNRYSLQRYVSTFDNLAARAEWSLKRREPIGRTNHGRI